ncbi:hypothetical protein LOCC1_G008023 [Lachnellula occidentalis]|uniref:Transglycosylase SLT domain-containing protein n=1 Tax=Lachnellula occidentalis TaxID=215460 RepID=A0A8H8RLE1_9HELO|nr:hypothetical protein LOCC1_G008023 [Lachnellula occidentalis]
MFTLQQQSTTVLTLFAFFTLLTFPTSSSFQDTAFPELTFIHFSTTTISTLYGLLSTTAAMPSYSAPFLIILALATQSFAAPAAIPNSYNEVSNLVDNYIAKRFDDGQYHPTPVAQVETSAAATSTLNPPLYTYGGPDNGTIISTSVLPTATTTRVTSTILSQPTSSATSSALTSLSETEVSTTGTVAKKTFSGNGGKGWPTIDQWLSFEDLWAKNVKGMGTCYAAPGTKAQAPTTDNEKKDIKASIQEVAQKTGVDKRYILATILQESSGCVRAGTTLSPGSVQVSNPGLMQDHNGSHNCHDKPAPCPKDTITGMLMDGTNGTLDVKGGGDGLKQTLATAEGLGAKAGSAQAAYWSSRIYNSGSYDGKKALEDPTLGATADYCDMMANRLIGWVG